MIIFFYSFEKEFIGGIKIIKLLHDKYFISIEEPPKPIIRTKTSVSNDYQFSPCSLQQLGNTFMYNYEYLGPSQRLVLTPLTHRAFLSLTQAVKNFHCGTLIGPAGTGKSETIKDLAKVNEIYNKKNLRPVVSSLSIGELHNGKRIFFFVKM